MRMELEDKGGSEAEETREELTMREMGSIFPETEEEKEEDKQEEEGVVWRTSSLVLEILHKDCLPRAQHSSIADLDTDTKESRTGNRWRGRGKRGGRGCSEDDLADQLIPSVTNQRKESIERDRDCKRISKSRIHSHSICVTSGSCDPSQGRDRDCREDDMADQMISLIDNQCKESIWRD
jgi:hypothetical protein